MIRIYIFHQRLRSPQRSHRKIYQPLVDLILHAQKYKVMFKILRYSVSCYFSTVSICLHCVQYDYLNKYVKKKKTTEKMHNYIEIKYHLNFLIINCYIYFAEKKKLKKVSPNFL